MKKRIISILLTASMLVGIMAMTAVPSSAAHPFTDVPDWATEYVNEVYEKGIMQGTGGTTFGSNATLTREQLVVTLYRISGSTVTGTLDSLKATFADAADISDWAWSAVEWASKEGITSGVKQGDALYFKPKNDVTRQEAAKFFITFIDYMKLDAPTDNTANLKDMDKVGDWALPYVERCIAAGIINGDGNGNFDPAGKTVRIAAAKMLACLPEAKSESIFGLDTRVNTDPKDPTPSALGKVDLSAYDAPEGFELSRAALVGDSPLDAGMLSATGNACHGWHESRIARTEYGTYIVYANDEYLDPEYLTGQHGYVRATSQFILVKVTSDGFKIVLSGEYKCTAGSCASNVLVGEDGIIYITTFYIGGINHQESAPMVIYTFDTKTDSLVKKSETNKPFKLQDTFKTHGYGYYQPIYDKAMGKIYALYVAGEWPGYFSWFIYDIATDTWEEECYLIEIPYRSSYMHAYADGKGGIFFVAARNPPSWAVEDSYDGKVQFTQGGYLFDGLYLITIPDMTKEEFTIQDIYAPDYTNEKEFPKNPGGKVQPANACHYNGGVTYVDSRGYFYVVYRVNDKYFYVIYDTQNNFKTVRMNKELQLLERTNYDYQFVISENTNGDVFLMAINTKSSDATFELYKIDVNAPKVNVNILKDSNGNPTSVKIPMRTGGGYLSHARLSFTSTRNNSVQDNIVSIVTHSGTAKRGLTLGDQDTSNIDTLIYSGGGSTNNYYYYSVKLPD